MGAITNALLGKAYRTSPKVEAEATAVVSQRESTRVGKTNARLFRVWSQNSEWVRAAVNIRKNQLTQAEWDIVPRDTTKSHDERAMARIKELLLTPNNMTESFATFLDPIAEDLLTLDAGCIEKERTLGGDIYALHAIDGADVKVSRVWDGNPDEPRYWWTPNEIIDVPFRNADLIYMMMNRGTYRVVGLSPLETLKITIDSELSGSLFNSRQVKNAAPDGIFDLGEQARPEHVESFRSYWQAEVAGMGALAFIGGTKNAKFIPFRSSNRDMQYLEWLTYLVRKIAAVFGLSPQDLGLTFDINRATAEVVQEQTDDRGLRPLLSNVQDYFTREIVWDESFGGVENNLAFRFARLNLRESKAKADINKVSLAGVPWVTPNEARMDAGRPPIGDPADEANPFNKLMANTPRGFVLLEDIPSAGDVIDTSEPAPVNGTSDEGRTDSGSRER